MFVQLFTHTVLYYVHTGLHCYIVLI